MVSAGGTGFEAEIMETAQLGSQTLLTFPYYVCYVVNGPSATSGGSLRVWAAHRNLVTIV